VFINCPFDGAYQPLTECIVFTVIACGFSPVSALQEQDSGTIRLDKIKRLIGSSRLGIHDISRTEVDGIYHLPRFNMPFELGMDIAACHYGESFLRTKRIIILDAERYRYQKFISDIAGQDIVAHDNSVAETIGKIRPWLNAWTELEKAPLIGSKILIEIHQDFQNELLEFCERRGLDAHHLDFIDLTCVMQSWTKTNPGRFSNAYRRSLE
jgi:hypothetical protein